MTNPVLTCAKTIVEAVAIGGFIGTVLFGSALLTSKEAPAQGFAPKEVLAFATAYFAVCNEPEDTLNASTRTGIGKYALDAGIDLNSDANRVEIMLLATEEIEPLRAAGREGCKNYRSLIEVLFP